MEKYYIKSLIGEIAKGLEDLIARGVIKKDQRVMLYGLDRYSFAMRTILSNKGFNNIACYLSDDKASVIAVNRDIKNFACRYLNKTMDLIYADEVSERLIPFDDNVVVLIASKTYQREKEKLEKLGYKENQHFYKVCDFYDKELEKIFRDKKKISLQEIQGVEKDILAYVDKLCKKNGLRYWVCGGTLLGAIRHKGFIPWDDDVDIFLPWNDYQRFVEAFEENDKYSMLGMGTADTIDFCDMFARVVDKRTFLLEDIGTVQKKTFLGIDVFALIGFPEREEERHLLFERYKELNRVMWQEFYAANGDADIFPKWYRELRWYFEQYEFDRAEYVGVLGTAYGERDCTHKNVYNATLRMPFEDIEVNVPVGYKEYLDNLYGRDWGIIPEENKRKSHHDIKAFWK